MIEIIVAVIGVLGVVAAAVIPNIISNKRIEKQVKEIAEHEKENYLGLLRLTVMAEEMPISERIIAGDKYIKAGGNGDVKKFYHKLLQSHIK